MLEDSKLDFNGTITIGINEFFAKSLKQILEEHNLNLHVGRIKSIRYSGNGALVVIEIS